MKTKAIFVFIFFFPLTSFVVSARAQEVPLDSSRAIMLDTANPRHATVRLMARSYGDSVVLRLGITKSGAWSIGNKFGYKIERVALGTDGAFDRSAFQLLTPTPMKPWPLARWKDRFSTLPDSEQGFVAIAAQMLYGKSTPPRLQGGKDVSGLGLAGQEFEDRFSFALFAADVDARTAEASGLRLADHNVHLGESYIYRAFVSGGDPTYAIDTAYLVVAVTPPDSIPAPINLVADTGDGKLRVHWYHPSIGGYTAYYVYRSDDGGATYKRLNRTPLIAMRTAKMKGPPQPVFTDTTVVNYRRYRYAVRGITPFGELSEAAFVDAFPMDLTPPPAPIPDDPKQVGTHNIHIAWQERNPPGDLAGFLIARSTNSLSGFHFLQNKPLPKTDHEFTDDSATDAEPYYEVAAIDTAGNFARSIVVSSELIDTVPPAPPTGLIGKMDTNGIVTLHWNLGPERNLIGYRVLWANDPKHEFTQRTGEVWGDTTFTDTVAMNTLTKFVYYRVAAVNIRKNHSEMSAIAAVKRPDRIPPEPSVFTDVIATDSTAELRWAHSRSEDLARQLLYRRSVAYDNVTTSAWEEIATLSRTAELYSDSKVKQRTMYQYQIVAVDSDGNRSKPSAPVQARPFDRGVRPVPTNLQVMFDEKTKHVHLTWAYSQRSEDYWFIVYRGTGTGSLAQYHGVKSNELSFDDPSPYSGEYNYAVRMEARTGAQSPLSEAVSVTVK